jgi:hypothetical protein
MIEFLKNKKPGDSTLDDNERKKKALEQAAESDRTQPINFIGKRYYTREYINKANKELSEKISTEHGSGDVESKLAEWEFVYTLGHEEVLPGCRANLASEYDDHINGIDVVCKLKNKDDDQPYVFGIDICSAINPDAVSKKFARGDYPRGDVPAGCSFVKFYEDDGYVACLKGVPRFVLGASPLFVSHQKYLNNFHLREDGSVSHTPDTDLQFNVLSSLFIQSSNLRKKLQKKGTGDELIRKRAIETCEAVRLASGRALLRLMGMKNGEDFYKRLGEELNKARRLKVNGYVDGCYANVLNESLKRQNPD